MTTSGCSEWRVAAGKAELVRIAQHEGEEQEDTDEYGETPGRVAMAETED